MVLLQLSYLPTFDAMPTAGKACRQISNHKTLPRLENTIINNKVHCKIATC